MTTKNAFAVCSSNPIQANSCWKFFKSCPPSINCYTHCCHRLFPDILRHHQAPCYYLHLHKQRLPVSCSLLSCLAVLFLDRVERNALSTYQPDDLFKCYVHHIYFQTIDEVHADNFHHFINQQHPHIKYEIERPTLTTNDDGATKKPLFIHYKSALHEGNRITGLRSSDLTKLKNVVYRITYLQFQN